MTRFGRCGLSTMLSVAIAAGAALAQQQGPPPAGPMGFLGGMMGGPGGGDFQLISNPSVQKDLNLTTKQKTQLRSVEEATKANMREMFAAVRENGIDPQAMGEQITAFRQEQEANASRVLDKKQKARLSQIKLQRDGMIAVSRSEVASKLKITIPQTKQIKKVVEAMNKEIAAAMPPMPEGFGGPPGGFGGPPGGGPPGGEGNDNGDGAPTPKKKGGNRPPAKNGDAGNDPNGAGGQDGPGGPGGFGGPGGPGSPEFAEFQAKMEKGFETMGKARESAAKQIEAILTDDQKAAWTKLTGDPFDLSTLKQGPGGPGGPRDKGANKKTTKKKDAGDDGDK
jgi:Spy/CpxP family protein refolding chaperone